MATHALRNVAVLGATGSIGASALDVIARHPGRYRARVLAAGHNVDALVALCVAHRPDHAVIADEESYLRLRDGLADAGLPTQAHAGTPALDALVSGPECDTVVAAIVGAAGLSSTLAAARAGKRLLLANKESLVLAGELVTRAADASGAEIIPIDSEHNAIFQCLRSRQAQGDVSRIVLTASGGPFRQRDPASLREVTPEQACAHPNWVMGRKISIDSATMMNKALEVIEARYLFGLAPAQLDVVIHPQSTIHSMVQYHDTSVVAQMGTPDMRVPIAYGLSWPERVASGATALDFHALSAMTFEAIDDHGHPERFPGLRLAWEALDAPAGTTAVLNAANEVAVAAFLDRRIRFDQIHAVNLATLSAVLPSNPASLEALLALDALARESAACCARGLAA